jgi:hypothetical protein
MFIHSFIPVRRANLQTVTSNAAGLMDNYYVEALRDYAAVTYQDLHSYLIEGFRYWYEILTPSQEEGWADVDEADAPAEDAREGAVVHADTVPPHATFNMAFKSAAASAAQAADADAAMDAGAAPAPGCGCGPGGCSRIMIEYSSILCLNSMDF